VASERRLLGGGGKKAGSLKGKNSHQKKQIKERLEKEFFKGARRASLRSNYLGVNDRESRDVKAPKRKRGGEEKRISLGKTLREDAKKKEGGEGNSLEDNYRVPPNELPKKTWEARPQRRGGGKGNRARRLKERVIGLYINGKSRAAEVKGKGIPERRKKTRKKKNA